MAFTGFQQITTAQINQTYTTGNDTALGTYGADRRGNIYAWTLNGAVALVAGKANISPAKVTNDTNRSLAAASAVAAGGRVFTVSGGGTVASNAYAGGYAVINDGTGKGQIFQIQSNSADYVSGSDTHAVDVYIHDSIIAALAVTDTKVALMNNQWANVVVHPGSSEAYFCAGVNETAVPAASYFWSKVRGLTSVLSDGVIAKGANACLTGGAVAGALATYVDSTVIEIVGVAPEATVDTKYYGVYMTVV